MDARTAKQVLDRITAQQAQSSGLATRRFGYRSRRLESVDRASHGPFELPFWTGWIFNTTLENIIAAKEPEVFKKPGFNLYRIFDPRKPPGQQVRYIGMTRGAVANRIRNHLSTAPSVIRKRGRYQTRLHNELMISTNKDHAGIIRVDMGRITQKPLKVPGGLGFLHAYELLIQQVEKPVHWHRDVTTFED